MNKKITKKHVRQLVRNYQAVRALSYGHAVWCKNENITILKYETEPCNGHDIVSDVYYYVNSPSEYVTHIHFTGLGVKEDYPTVSEVEGV